MVLWLPGSRELQPLSDPAIPRTCVTTGFSSLGLSSDLFWERVAEAFRES